MSSRQPRLLHGFGQFSLIQALTRRLHRSQECALGESLRGPGLFLPCFRSMRADCRGATEAVSIEIRTATSAGVRRSAWADPGLTISALSAH